MQKRSNQNGTIYSAVFDVFNYTVLLCVALITILPFYNVIITSFTSAKAFFEHPFMLYPIDFNFASYAELFQNSIVFKAFRNSIFLVVFGTAYSMLLNITCAYVLTKRNVFGIKFLFYMIVITLFFGGGLIPSYLLVKNLGLMNTIWALILPAGIDTFYMLLIYNTIEDVPKELDEAATIDGANEMVVLFKIILPVIVPTIAAISLFTMVNKWNDWYSAMLYIKDQAKYPLTYWLKTMLTQINISTNVTGAESAKMIKSFPMGVQRASIIFTMLPIMLVYPFIQRYFAKGIMLGAVKG